MSAINLPRGANRIFSRLLYQADGVTPLLVSSLHAASVVLSQGGATVATYIMGTGNQLRAGAASNELYLELVSTVTAGLNTVTPLMARWTLAVPDADFIVEPTYFIDVQDETLANIK